MQPLFYAALAFALGIGVSRVPAHAHLFSVWLLGALGAAMLLVRPFPRLLTVSALLFCLVAGFQVGRRASRRQTAPNLLQLRAAELSTGGADGIDVSGYLRDAPVIHSDFVRLDLTAVSLEGHGQIWQVSGGVRLYSYPPAKHRRAWPGALAHLQAGTGIRALARLHPPLGFHDPGVPDAAAQAQRSGVELTGTLLPDGWQPAPDLQAPAGLRRRAAAWAWIASGLDRILPPARNARLNAVLHGMLLGDLDRLDDATRAQFQIDGIYHLLVVAGLHVGVLAALLMALLSRLFGKLRGRLWAGGMTLTVLIAYSWVIAGHTPTERATLMLGLYFIARAWYRERQPLNAVGAAALVLLVLHPLDLFEAGFQMSVGAATLLAGVAAPVLRRSSQPLVRATRRLDDQGYDESFEPRIAQFRIDLRMIATRLGWLWRPLGWRLFPLGLRLALELYEVVLISLILQIGFTAFMVVYFHRANPWTPLVNAVAVPLAGVMLPVAWCGLGLQALWHPLAAPVGWLLQGLGRWLLGTAAWASAWPGAQLRVPTPPVWAIAAFAAAMAAWLIGARRPRRWALATSLAALAAAAALSWLPFAPRLPKGKLTATVLDVGQGDSIFVVFPDGRTLLVDGGPTFRDGREAGTEVVCPYLWSLGLRHIDAVLLTHAHLDHIGGLDAVIENFHPEEVWVSRTLPRDAETRAFLQTALAHTARLRRVAGGERFRVGSAYLDVLLPPPDYQGGELPSNNDSVMIRLQYGRGSMLLAGDAEAAGEAWVLAHHLPVASAVLKVGHHGSNSSTTAAFLTAVHPQVGLISVGAGNRYGLPSGSTLRELAQQGVRTFRTDQQGAIECEMDGESLKVSID